MTQGEKFIDLLNTYLDAQESVRNYTKIGLRFNDSKKFEKEFNSEIKRERRLKKELIELINKFFITNDK